MQRQTTGINLHGALGANPLQGAGYLSAVLTRLVPMVGVGVTLLVTAGCSGVPESFQTCPTSTPMAAWPGYVVDLRVSTGVLIEVDVFDDGRETVGRWSIESVDLGSTADVMRESLVTQGFTIEGSGDASNIAYGRNDTGQVVDIRASTVDACGRVVVTVDSIAALQPDPPTWLE